ncbi:MAG: F0F1 ATP synthase subunit alpha [Clostridiales bacterium]|jgi:F-type H+-transporting ATPase subunit alpha|nr:F0F1 ATP synthase subunit alpha [Clostridiales bacterium]
MLEFDTSRIGSFLKDKIAKYEYEPKVYDYGKVESCADGVVHISGLSRSRYGELLEFENSSFGIALDLHLDGVGAVLLSRANEVSAGTIVRGTGRVADIGVGQRLLGRVVDSIGRPLDGKPLEPAEFRMLESPAPTIMQRSPVTTPMATGILAIDSMIPIGRGQRELIIGDRQTGKTSIALTTMLNQKGKDVYCVYCSIGQKASTIAKLVHILTEEGAMAHTAVVVSTASDSPAMQYLAPYAASAIAEHFMYEGKDALVIYDDLSKHAVAYRAMSLLLRRPSGREAYPGDVFYLHSRLLERAAKLNADMGGGSLTALPIVETMAGDISAYIPTNVISITDGQIYLESELFNAGIRPAVNVGLSVSRVGRAAQHNAMKKVSKNMRLDIAQYREMAVFAQFGSDVDYSTKQMLMRGERLIELTKQSQNSILSLAEQTVLLMAFSKGIFMNVNTRDISEYKEKLLDYLKTNCTEALSIIDTTGDLPDEIDSIINRAIDDFAGDGS